MEFYLTQIIRTVYEGDFDRGLKHGFGKIVYPSGNYYEGNWAFDKKEGYGVMYWSNTNEKVRIYLMQI